MIPYTLALQMKEAGFPQKGRDYLCPSSCLWPSMWHKTHTVYKPTLEEVIEACGDDLFSIQREEDDDGYIGWFASQGTRFFSRGPTPLEAVCRLWLALNKT